VQPVAGSVGIDCSRLLVPGCSGIFAVVVVVAVVDCLGSPDCIGCTVLAVGSAVAVVPGCMPAVVDTW